IRKTVESIFNSNSNNIFFEGNVIENFQNYLSSLPLEKVGALGHILISLAILSSLVSVVFIFYGDSFILYYKIETKFPKLAKFIQLRRKFQHYYIVVNISMIVLALFLIIYVNLIVLLN